MVEFAIFGAHLNEEIRDVFVIGEGRVRGVGGVEEACQALRQSGTLNCRITHGEHTMNRRAASAVYLCTRRGRGPRRLPLSLRRLLLLLQTPADALSPPVPPCLI